MQPRRNRNCMWSEREDGRRVVVSEFRIKVEGQKDDYVYASLPLPNTIQRPKLHVRRSSIHRSLHDAASL